MKFKTIVFLLLVVCALFLPTTSAEINYKVQPDGSVLYDTGNQVFGLSTFEATDGIKYLTSDYPGSDFVYHGTYWSIPSPSPLSGRFYEDGRIYLGKDTNHYLGIKPVGIFYVNYQDPTERQQLISLTSVSLSVNDNIATYSQGPVDIVFTNSFSRTKGDVIFPNAPPVPTVSNPALAVVWEIVGHAGINTEDGEKSIWWFDEAKAAFPIGDIQNNGSATLKKKIFRQGGKIYLVEGVGYNWISDVNRTDSHFIIDPTIQYNGSDNWANTSGTMIEHGDGNLRSPPNITTGLISYWNPTTGVGSGSTLTDIWDNNDGTISGATWNVSGGGLDFDGVNDQVIISSDASLNLTANFTLETCIKPNDLSTEWQVVLLKGAYDANVRAYSIYLNYDEVYISWYNDGWKSFASTSGNLQNDIVYHIVYVRTTTNETIYINGVKNTEDVISSSMLSNNYDMRLGWKGQFESVEIFNGIIGQTKIYSQPLSNDEINESRDNFHTITSYREINTPLSADIGQVWKYVNISGTDAGTNTSGLLQINGSHDNLTFNGWEDVNSTYDIGDNITIPIPQEYRYASFRWYSNTTYQPETDIIESVVLSSSSPTPPSISLVSIIPSPLQSNYSGVTVISYMVESYHPLNLSSLAFLYGLNYTTTGDMHNYIATPPNDISSEGIYLAPNRNVTPYLSWEFNDTITEGNVWQWGGGDNNSWWIEKNPVNATHTYINATGVTQHILPSSFYIQKLAMYNAPKTGFDINRQQGLIFKMWNVEETRNRGHNYIANLYFDTSWESTLPNYPVEVGFCNYSYDPAVDDIDTCPYCIKFGEWDGNRWVNHSWVPSANASYAYPLIVNGSQYTEPIPTDINYIWLRSNTISSKSYILNATDHDPGITNITFAQTDTMWTYNELNGVTTPVAYTPSFFTTFVRNDEDLLHHLYIADDTGVWGHSDIFSESIGVSSVPVSPVSFDYFNVTCDESYHDHEMDATYDQGTVGVGMHCPGDPDGTAVSHNLTLHYYPNMTLVAVINNTFTTTGYEDVEIEFTTTPYYSPDTLYTLKCVSIDGDDNVATKWLISYFALDADGNRGWVKDSMLLFWGMDDIPTLYTEVNNNSLISYDGGSDIYTMHVPFFKSKGNDTFNFNETVHLESLNNTDVSFFRFMGRTNFNNANIYGWNTTIDTAAPITDEYRSYVYSLTMTCGNITNSDFSYLGSDFYRQEGLNYVGNSYPYLIHNSTFSNNAEGPIFEECVDFTISNCTISDNVNVGVGVYFSDGFIIENNSISSNGGRGITMYEANNNTISYNDITNSGIHGIHYWSNSINNTCTGNDITGSAPYDYYLSSSSTGNFIVNPASLTDRIRVTSTSSVNIENTDNTAFSEDSLSTSYAYLTNFSMYISGVSQTFDITQRDMTIVPINDNLSIKNLEWGNTIQFNAASDIGVNQTWFNITSDRWKGEQISIFIDGLPYNTSYADDNGTLAYNYSVSIGDDFFEFVLSIPPSPVPVSIFIFMGVLLFVFAGSSFVLAGVSSIFTSILSVMFSFIMSKIAINGSLVQNVGGISSTGAVVQGVTRIEIPALSYILIFVGLFMAVVLVVQVLREIKFRNSQDTIELDL